MSPNECLRRLHQVAYAWVVMSTARAGAKP